MRENTQKIHTHYIINLIFLNMMKQKDLGYVK